MYICEHVYAEHIKKFQFTMYFICFSAIHYWLVETTAYAYIYILTVLAYGYEK